MATHPNIIYILGDDHRADYLGCAGHEILQTPNLDQLAADGAYFRNAFCTSPACMPSRTCHYLGQWERRHGINFNSGTSVTPEAWEDSFPARLQQAGYFIGWVGKNHVPVGEKGYGHLEQKFDYWYGNHGHSGFYPKEFASHGPEIYSNARHDTQIEVFEEAVHDFLRPDVRFRRNLLQPLPERPEDRPFLLCLTFNLPHGWGTSTMQLRPSDDDQYKRAYRDVQHRLQPPPTYLDEQQAWEQPRLPLEVWNAQYICQYDYVKSPIFLRERQVRTCQTVGGMDRMLGRLRETLEEMGLADNTILVFSTDHGLHHGEHGIGGKCFLYEEDLRIPTIVYDPRQTVSGQQRDELVVVPDLGVTVLDLAGVDIPPTMQGTSLAPLLAGDSPAWRQALFAEQLMDIQNYPRSECIRTHEWKYIRYFQRTEDPAQAQRKFRGTLDVYNDCLLSTLQNEQPIYEELYDLVNDPGETTNCIDESQAPLETLRQQLRHLAWEARQDEEPPRTMRTVGAY